jgi:nucleotide-binding universal stress UspA family protein
MKTHSQQGLDRPQVSDEAAQPAKLAPTTILLPMQSADSAEGTLEAALSLARSYSALITCLRISPIEAHVVFSGFGGVFVMDRVMKALDEGEAELRAKIEGKLNKEDVSWDYSQVTGNVATQLVRYAALADLVVIGREPHRVGFVGPSVGLLGDLVSRSRTPLFIPQDNAAPCDATGPALIAWDGSYEAANAIRSALGMLILAPEVHIVQIEEQKTEVFPSTRLLEYLSRHGIHAELTVEPEAKLDREMISDILIARAMAVEASYLVMGGYNHSRVGEYLFGGVTRNMLTGCPLPLVIAQ